MNILTVYHGDKCIDGFTSAWLSTVAASQTGHKPPELYPLTYEDGQEEELQQHIVSQFVLQHHYDVIYVLDISLSLECLAIIVKTTKAKIVILDHHKTAFNMYVPDVPRTKNERASISLHDGQVSIALNNGLSGAGMTYLYFFPDTEVPLLVQHVQDRDIWKFDMKNTKAVDQYLKNAEQTIESWSNTNACMCHKTTYDSLVSYGEYLLENHEARVKAIANLAEWIVLDGATGLGVRCGHEYASDTGHALCKISNTFGLTYCSMGNGILKVSLRSEGDYDVEVMAKKLGGGGHKNAAGFIILADDFFSGDLA